MNTAAQTLTVAKRIITERGWVQGMATGPGGSVCAAQALGLAAQSMGEVSNATTGFLLAINESEGGRWIGMTIPMWNDHPGRTKEEVLRMFDTAIGLVDPSVKQLTVPDQWVRNSLTEDALCLPKATVLDKVKELVGV